MNRDDIIRMAQEAGYVYHVSGGTGTYVQFYWDQLEQFAHLVAAEEREACAKVCDEKVAAEYATGKVDHNEIGWTQACAIAIRAGGDALAKLNQAAEDDGEPL
jgi:hypothetical protein